MSKPYKQQRQRLVDAAPEMLELIKDFVQDCEARGILLSHIREGRSIIERIEGKRFEHRFIPKTAGK